MKAKDVIDLLGQVTMTIFVEQIRKMTWGGRHNEGLTHVENKMTLGKGKETDVKEDDHVLKLLKKLKVEVTM